MRRFLVTTVVLALAGCASSGMDEAECRTADWRAVGYEDGAQGRNASAFGARRRACAEHGIMANFDAYQDGHAQGLTIFCRPQNGYNLGTRGYRYAGACPAHLEGGFLAAHADGYGLYQRRATLKRIGKRLNTSRKRAKDIEFMLVEKTSLLVSPTVAPTRRAAIAVELKQLTEEKIEVEHAIRRLEVDHAEAERDYEDYRSRITSQYRG